MQRRPWPWACRLHASSLPVQVAASAAVAASGCEPLAAAPARWWRVMAPNVQSATLRLPASGVAAQAGPGMEGMPIAAPLHDPRAAPAAAAFAQEVVAALVIACEATAQAANR